MNGKRGSDVVQELIELGQIIADFDGALPSHAAELRRAAREKLEEIIRKNRGRGR